MTGLRATAYYTKQAPFCHAERGLFVILPWDMPTGGHEKCLIKNRSNAYFFL